ncbi:MAG: hypothetical protein OEV66_02785 [Spirochaetia bacterium]|nr:hypothetical protein [Spirochaetia bacterium]
MNKNLVAVFLVLIWCYNEAFAQTVYSPDELVTQSMQQKTPDTDAGNEPEKESKLRRAEIIFLISLPFVAITTLLLTSGAYLIADPTYGFYLPALPPEILPFMIFSTVLTSGMIAYNDYRIMAEKEKSRLNQIQFGVNFEKKF